MALVHKGERLPRNVGDEIANVIKEWAMGHGATHFCHWFQPMTGLTAEKHDAFITTRTSETGTDAGAGAVYRLGPDPVRAGHVLLFK